jgi:hypothetical protein
LREKSTVWKIHQKKVVEQYPISFSFVCGAVSFDLVEQYPLDLVEQYPRDTAPNTKEKLMGYCSTFF